MVAAEWALTLSMLALVQGAPGSLVSLGELLDRLKRGSGTSGSEEFRELESKVRDGRKEWLFHKMLLLNLVVAFSAEHGMPEDLVKYCKSELPKIQAELEGL